MLQILANINDVLYKFKFTFGVMPSNVLKLFLLEQFLLKSSQNKKLKKLELVMKTTYGPNLTLFVFSLSKLKCIVM